MDFPLEELERDGEQEVIEILKERRRAICEFIVKIFNSFRLLDNYFMDGTLNHIKNVLSLLEDQSKNDKINLAFIEKFNPLTNK